MLKYFWRSATDQSPTSLSRIELLSRQERDEEDEEGISHMDAGPIHSTGLSGAGAK